MPGPRKLLADVRLALSKEDLNTAASPALAAASLTAKAVSWAREKLSSAQGPATTKCRVLKTSYRASFEPVAMSSIPRVSKDYRG